MTPEAFALSKNGFKSTGKSFNFDPFGLRKPKLPKSMKSVMGGYGYNKNSMQAPMSAPMPPMAPLAPLPPMKLVDPLPKAAKNHQQHDFSFLPQTRLTPMTQGASHAQFDQMFGPHINAPMSNHQSISSAHREFDAILGNHVMDNHVQTYGGIF